MVIRFPPRKPYDPGVRMGWPAVTLARPPVRSVQSPRLLAHRFAEVRREARRERLWIVLLGVAEFAAISLFLALIAVGSSLYIGALL